MRNVFERRRAEGSGGERATRLGSRGGSQLADVSSSPPNYPRAILYSRLTPPRFPSLPFPSFLPSPSLSRGSCHLGMKGGSSSIARRLTSGVAPNSRRRLSLPNYATASREGVLPPPPPGLHPPPSPARVPNIPVLFISGLFVQSGPVGARSAASQAGARTATGTKRGAGSLLLRPEEVSAGLRHFTPRPIEKFGDGARPPRSPGSRQQPGRQMKMIAA